MLIVAGLSLKNLKPRVWDATSPYYVPGLDAIMVSFAEIYSQRSVFNDMMSLGMREFLGIPPNVRVYLDNGAFYFLRRSGRMPRKAYEEFVESGRPDWYPIPEEFIPHPAMRTARQQECYSKTMAANRAYQRDGFVPVMHVGKMLPLYMKAVREHHKLNKKKRLAVGGIVPNLLRAPKALPYAQVLAALRSVRTTFATKEMHVFGLGGTATLHIAALLGFDSLDSSGWRNRAARGIVQLPGSGDRMIADLGKWRGRPPSEDEWELLRTCKCNACQQDGLRGLTASGMAGFCHRASHNLWILLREAEWIRDRLDRGSYFNGYRSRIKNTIYAPIVETLAMDYHSRCK